VRRKRRRNLDTLTSRIWQGRFELFNNRELPCIILIMALSMSAELCKHSAILPTRQSIQSNTRPTSLLLSNFLGRLHFQQTGPPSNPTRPIQQHFTLVRASAAGNGNSIGRFFKKVLNSTPIIGLLSNLTVDAGTPFIYYSQFGRQVADRASQETDEAFSDFEAIHGKVSCIFSYSLVYPSRGNAMWSVS
jgi:hypothetical protein